MSVESFLENYSGSEAANPANRGTEIVFASLETHVLAEPCSHCMSDISAGLSERYLAGNLDEDDIEMIVEHLQQCQQCQEQQNIEMAMRSLLRRCCQEDKAPNDLRVRVQHISIMTA